MDKPISLLLVEDRSEFAVLFQEVARRAGCDCVVARTLEEAKQQTLDSHMAIFCDLHLPDCAVDDVIEWLGPLAIPVIVVTIDGDAEIAFRLGERRIPVLSKDGLTTLCIRNAIEWCKGHTSWTNRVLNHVDELRQVVATRGK